MEREGDVACEAQPTLDLHATPWAGPLSWLGVGVAPTFLALATPQLHTTFWGGGLTRLVFLSLHMWIALATMHDAGDG